MKSSELLRLLKREGIKVERQGKGSHIIPVRQNGSQFSFPFHGSDEMGLEIKIKKWAGLK